MFTRKEQIDKKTGPNGIGRFQYLSLLKQEFEKTNSPGMYYILIVIFML